MAARRAAAKAAAAAEKEPDKKDEKKLSIETREEKKEEHIGELKSPILEEMKKKEEKEYPKIKERVTEKITERIIICPPGQNPCQPLPPQRYCNCPPDMEGIRGSCDGPRRKKGRKRRDKGDKGGEGICQHPFCILQRAQIRSQGLPMFPPPPRQQPNTPPVIICQTPVLCCCSNCNEPDSDSSDSDGADPPRDKMADHLTFMNLVLAASNVIKESPNCQQLNGGK